MKKYLAIAMAALLLVCSLASCAGGKTGDIDDYTPEVDYLITDKGTFYFEEAEGETAILVNYVGKATAGDHVEIPATFGDRMGHSFTSGWSNFVDAVEDLVVGLAYGWMWIVILAVAVVLGVKTARKKVRIRKAEKMSDKQDKT